MKHGLNNIDYENFHEIVLSFLNAHPPLKKKHLRANHASFVTKEFRKADTLNRSNVSSVKYRTETITSLGAKIWKISPNDYEELTSLSTLKSKIKNWETDKCPCRLCRTYIQRVGFI